MNNLLEFLRFGSVGGIATSVHYGVAATLMLFGISALVANAIGFACAFWFGFLGHRYFTFRNSGADMWQSLVRYCVVSLASFLCGQALLVLLLTRDWLPEQLSLFMTIGIVAAVNFLLGRFWAFAAAPKGAHWRKLKTSSDLYGEKS